jgi:hypothetical protein
VPRIVVAVFTALGSITVAGSVVFYLLAGERAARPLGAVKQFMADNNAVVMMVVLLLGRRQAPRRRPRRPVALTQRTSGLTLARSERAGRWR